LLSINPITAIEEDTYPHPNNVAENSYNQLCRDNVNQCIVISGESGAGKSEVCKRMIQFLLDGKVLLDAVNPILEAFGNAKTLNNANSSRFGKFIKLYFENGEFQYANVATYLLERSRVTTSGNSFHVFYERSKELLESLTILGFSQSDQQGVFDIVDAIVHLLDLDFNSDLDLEPSAKLLGLDKTNLRQILCEKRLTIRGETSVSLRDASGASQARDALAKTLYHELFGWIVSKINAALNRNSIRQSDSFVGILDIFGFECFHINRFEQMLINYANDALQTAFSRQIFQTELEIYREEGLQVPANIKIDHSLCVDLFHGLFAAINTVCQYPEPSDRKLLNRFNETFQKHECFPKPHPKLASQVFIVKHYSQQVTYHVEGFVETNMDSLPCEPSQMFGSSSHPILQSITQDSKFRNSIVSKFEKQMRSLIDVLDHTSCSFVRCIKPNQSLDSTIGFDKVFVNRQLECLSVPQTVQLLQAGHPAKIAYSKILPCELPTWKTRIAIQTIMKNSGIHPDEFKFGATRVFLTSQAIGILYHTKRDYSEEIEQAWCVHILKQKSRMVALVNRCKTKVHLANKVQSWWRMKFSCLEFNRLKNGMTKLQFHFRTQVANKEIMASKIQNFLRGVSIYLSFQRQRRACIVLQRFWIANMWAYSDSDSEIGYDADDDTLPYSKVNELPPPMIAKKTQRLSFFKKIVFFEKPSAVARQQSKVLTKLKTALKKQRIGQIIEYTAAAKKLQLESNKTVVQAEGIIKGIMKAQGSKLLREAIHKQDASELSMAIKRAIKFHIEDTVLLNSATAMLYSIAQAS